MSDAFSLNHVEQEIVLQGHIDIQGHAYLDEGGPLGTLADVSSALTAEGATEEEALNNLEEEIRRAVTEATRVA